MARAEDLADAEVARLKLEIERVAAKLLAWLKDQAGGATEMDQAIAAAAGQDLGRILGEIGFDDASLRVVAAFEEVALAVREDLRAQIGQLTGVSFTTLRTFVARVSSRLILVRADAADRAREVLFEMAAANAPIADGMQRVAEAARARLSTVVTEVSTSLFGFLREGLIQQAEGSGIDLFRYGGPDDDVIRPFCARCVGKVFTAGDLDRMENGARQPKPVSRFLGGWNCRHRLEPVSRESVDLEDCGGPEARRIVSSERAGPNERRWIADNRGRLVAGKIVRARS